ncbi:MAG: dependent oxidoreductase [Acidobacteriaceae bacterium]|nr:dependent oxidoreductase [Acidobacteriaceae bacterium]
MDRSGSLPQRSYADYSFWLGDAGDLTPRSGLRRSEEVDVAILGAGYTGLWTAYYLLRTRPEWKIAVVERDIAGYGASGRNGGWCSPRFPMSAGELIRRFGAEKTRTMLSALRDSGEAMHSVCEEEGIDACFRAAGTLTLARGAHQWPALQATFRAYQQLGLADRYHLLSAADVMTHIRATNVHGGLYTPDGASLHPGRLVRGLARAVEARGGVIYEQAAVTEVCGGSRPVLRTASAEIVAREAIVLAGEAYMTQMKRTHRALLPAYSLICLTEPLTASQWSEVGWERGENVASARSTVVYLTKTHDGRILFGSRGAPYAFGSRISDAQDRHAATIGMIQRSLVEWFPMLEGVRFEHAWGGPVGMPRDWLPAVRFNPDSRVGVACGYTGQGVVLSHLAGRMLAGRITGTQTGYEDLPIAGHRSPSWIPEPLRWLVVRYMQNALLRIDEAQEAGRSKPLDAPIAEALGRH